MAPFAYSGSMSYPSYTVWFRGHPACPCLAKWLPVYEKELLRRGVIQHNIDIYQLIGQVGASAGTHSKGGAFDLHQFTTKAVYVARQMGADASWHRPYNWDGHGGVEHMHGVLRGCPHNSPARYQIAAVDAGYNGLGYLGHGGKDYGPRPLSKRTWIQGIAWAENLQKPNVSRITKATEILMAAYKAASGARKLKIKNAIIALPGISVFEQNKRTVNVNAPLEAQGSGVTERGLDH